MSKARDRRTDGKEVDKDAEQKAASNCCGIVMPISAIEDCSESHWKEVKGILSDVIKTAGYTPSLVSEADEAGVIQARIVRNLYYNPIVVCDVSCRNPNVMFELGLRLAFDKAVVVIKDDKTPYSFDTSTIAHLIYPRDLRFGKMVQFKADLESSIRETAGILETDPKHSSFLAQYGPLVAAKIKPSEAGMYELIKDEIQGLRSEIRSIRSRNYPGSVGIRPRSLSSDQLSNIDDPEWVSHTFTVPVKLDHKRVNELLLNRRILPRAAIRNIADPLSDNTIIIVRAAADVHPDQIMSRLSRILDLPVSLIDGF